MQRDQGSSGVLCGLWSKLRQVHELAASSAVGKHTIFRLDAHYSQLYLCAVTFNNNDYGKRKSKLSGGI